MTYYGSKELAASFRTVRDNTIKIAEEIPEASYGYRVTPDTRSVAETLAHIALDTRFHVQALFLDRVSTIANFDFLSYFEKLSAEEAAPRSKAEILDLLRSEGEKFASYLDSATEDFLAEQVEHPQGMVPPARSRFQMLLSAKEHEMHHRGQLMVVERLLGITPHLTRRMQEYITATKAARAGN